MNLLVGTQGQCRAMHDNAGQFMATLGNAGQYRVMLGTTGQHRELQGKCKDVFPCIAMHCHVLPCIAMHYPVLPCVALHCPALPCIAWWEIMWYPGERTVLFVARPTRTICETPSCPLVCQQGVMEQQDRSSFWPCSPCCQSLVL